MAALCSAALDGRGSLKQWTALSFSNVWPKPRSRSPGENQIVQQRRLIAQLETDGSSASHAKYLLAGLELLETARRDSRDWLLKQLGGQADAGPLGPCGLRAPRCANTAGQVARPLLGGGAGGRSLGSV